MPKAENQPLDETVNNTNPIENQTENQSENYSPKSTSGQPESQPSTENIADQPENKVPEETAAQQASQQTEITKRSNHSTSPSTETAPSANPAQAKPQKNHKEKLTIAQSTSIAHSDIGFKATVITLLILCFFAAGTGLTLSIINYLREEDSAPISWGFTDTGNTASFEEGTIADIASKVAPGVVSIVTETRVSSWFGQSSTQTSAGTGMIVTKDGYVLTNKHVVDGANNIKIVLDDGTTYDKVSIVGTDPLNDVAFLKINDADNLPTVTLGDSKTISAGQQVIAIGNALGQYQNTITSGIISGTGRSVTAYSSDGSASENLTDMIQTDAAINAGNSGGPLVNAAGQVIGINTATSSGADGIGFAIPISSVKGMLKTITEGKTFNRAYMGIYYVNITPDVAVTYDLPVTAGAYLLSSQGKSVIAGGPGDQAGLQEKDIITKVNGVPVGKNGSVSTLVGEYAPGDTVQLTILRNGEEKTLKLTLGSYGSNASIQKS